MLEAETLALMVVEVTLLANHKPQVAQVALVAPGCGRSWGGDRYHGWEISLGRGGKREK